MDMFRLRKILEKDAHQPCAGNSLRVFFAETLLRQATITFRHQVKLINTTLRLESDFILHVKLKLSFIMHNLDFIFFEINNIYLVLMRANTTYPSSKIGDVNT